jgi:hypothetical protein
MIVIYRFFEGIKRLKIAGQEKKIPADSKPFLPLHFAINEAQ